MLSIEKIENIIKSKYNDLLKNKNIADTFKNFEFDIQRDEEFDYKIWKEITLFFDEKEKLYYEEKSKHDGDYFYTIKKFEIENNAIELKHYLNIKITKQDIIDWLETFTTKYNGRYLIPARECWAFYVYTSLTDIDGKKSKCFGLMATQYTEDIIILQAKKSQEYWRLYNIIKNLKE